MSTSIVDIIAALKTIGENAGFVKIEETLFNTLDNADTELPKLYIKLSSIDFDQQQFFSAVEIYNFDIIMINSSVDNNPISSLAVLYDSFFYEMRQIPLLQFIAKREYLTITNIDLSNDYESHKKYGGESLTIKMKITNPKTYGY